MPTSTRRSPRRQLSSAMRNEQPSVARVCHPAAHSAAPQPPAPAHTRNFPLPIPPASCPPSVLERGRTMEATRTAVPRLHHHRYNIRTGRHLLSRPLRDLLSDENGSTREGAKGKRKGREGCDGVCVFVPQSQRPTLSTWGGQGGGKRRRRRITHRPRALNRI